MTSPLAETWHMSSEATLMLLDAIPPEHLADRYAARTRTVGQQFSHLHDARLRWLAAVRSPHASALEKLPKEPAPSKTVLAQALRDSAAAMQAYLVECEATGKAKSWKGSPTSFLGYLVAHEAHHRGLAMVALRSGGLLLAKEIVYGLWDWGKRQQGCLRRGLAGSAGASCST